MNYNQHEDFEPRETDRQVEEPTHYTKVWNSNMLWEVGLILLVALLLVLCAWDFSAQGQEVAAITQAKRSMRQELSAEMIELSGKIDIDRVPITNSPFDIPFDAAKQSVVDTEFGRVGLEAFTQAKIINMGGVAFGIRRLRRSNWSNWSNCPLAFASGRYWQSPGEKVRQTHIAIRISRRVCA